MDSPYFLLLTGLVFIVFFGGMTLLRREGLSIRFAVEAVVVTLLFTGGQMLTGASIHPAFFLIILYLVTMRVPLAVDLANNFARRKKFDGAENIYQMAEKLWPDASGKNLVQVNRSVCWLQQGRVEEAMNSFRDLLERAKETQLSLKNETACRYNLAVAYERRHQDGLARNEFETVIEIMPASEYARRARMALERFANKNVP